MGSRVPPLPTSLVDVEKWASAALAEPWSGAAFAPVLTREALVALLERFSRLDPAVRRNLLLAALSLRKGVMLETKEELQRLADAALADDDDWVRTIGAAIGKFSGVLDMDAVMREFSVVRDTIEEFRERLQEGSGLQFHPLEDPFLSNNLVGPAPACNISEHFQLRERARSSEAASSASADERKTPLFGRTTSGPVFKSPTFAQRQQGGSSGFESPSFNSRSSLLSRTHRSESYAGRGGTNRPSRMKPLDVDAAISLQKARKAAEAAAEAVEKQKAEQAKKRRLGREESLPGTPASDTGTPFAPTPPTMSPATSLDDEAFIRMQQSMHMHPAQFLAQPAVAGLQAQPVRPVAQRLLPAEQAQASSRVLRDEEVEEGEIAEEGAMEDHPSEDQQRGALLPDLNYPPAADDSKTPQHRGLSFLTAAVSEALVNSGGTT
eukprot:jgi/Chlat1/7683/Chrsp64S07139